MTNKYDFVRLSNTEPNNLVYNTILQHTPVCRKIGSQKLNYIYFIDDLNLSYSCAADTSARFAVKPSANLELARQLLETKSIYSEANEHFISLNDINFVLSCTYPGLRILNTNFWPSKFRFFLQFIRKNSKFFPFESKANKTLDLYSFESKRKDSCGKRVHVATAALARGIPASFGSVSDRNRTGTCQIAHPSVFVGQGVFAAGACQASLFIQFQGCRTRGPRSSTCGFQIKAYQEIKQK